MKNPLTQAEIEPATFRFVAQHLNHCATAVPLASTHSFSNVTPDQLPRKIRTIFPPHKNETFPSLWLGLLASNYIRNLLLREVYKYLSTALVI